MSTSLQDSFARFRSSMTAHPLAEDTTGRDDNDDGSLIMRLIDEATHSSDAVHSEDFQYNSFRITETTPPLPKLPSPVVAVPMFTFPAALAGTTPPRSSPSGGAMIVRNDQGVFVLLPNVRAQPPPSYGHSPPSSPMASYTLPPPVVSQGKQRGSALTAPPPYRAK
jgi:hypothetical protein